MGAPGRTGRPLGFDPDAALDRVVEAFWVHGYTGTTTALLEEATALSRSSLLNTFGPKEQLFLAALDRYQQMTDEALLASLRTGRGGLADVDAFFIELARLKRSAPGSCGCLIVNTAAEPGPGTPQVQRRVDRYRHALTEALSAALDRAVDAGEISPDQRPERAQVLAALAVAVNWTAKSSGAVAAQRLARAASAVIADWQLR
jgi:TetR/AcrR family transcriptional regulator, transcriptional repressor for nem operon